MTTTTVQKPRAARGARRFGYVVAVAVNLAMLALIHAWPGWDVVPFLTPQTTDVLPFVDASIVTSILVNTLYVVRDGRGVKASGDLVTNLVSMLSLIRMWQVWPFDFDGVWAGWQPLTYVLLAVATIGTAIAALVQVATLVRLAVDRR
ncbi:hypothetical protein [Nocardioides dilutus]